MCLVTLAVEALNTASKRTLDAPSAYHAPRDVVKQFNEQLRQRWWTLCWHAVPAALMSTALDQLINRKQTFEGELERIEDRVSGLLFVVMARLSVEIVRGLTCCMH